MSDEKQFCLTLDLENDWYFDEPGYDHLTLEYLDEFIELIDSLDVPLTVFVVGRTLERFPDAVDRLDDELNCEFHLHSYQHDTSKEYDFRENIRRGKRAFREHFGHDPIGYRAPQGNIEPEEFRTLEEEGFIFDSSIFPSFRPGVYNNLDAPLQPYVPDQAEELVEIPIGATPKTRVPTAHSYLKLLGRPYMLYLRRAPLPETLVYNVHLQDLYRTDSYDELPTVKRLIYDRNIRQAPSFLEAVVGLLQNRGYQAIHITRAITIGGIDDTPLSNSTQKYNCADQGVQE
ncbi:polysaccharide deacetylase [Halorubrum ezzemoulense]|nr:polysaccharide deacetylase [Halorubrum ezzemoulense]